MRLEALNNKGEELFPYLKEFKDFYLAGGTALALQIGHRQSVDFDFFCEKEISKSLLGRVKKIFTGKNIKTSVNNRDELTVFVDGIKITFLNYPFPLLLDLVSFNGVKLLDVGEIGATKAYTVGRRGSYKDYVDLYFIIAEKHSSMEKIIELAEKKYGGEFNSRLFLEQLIYLEDAGGEDILFLKNPVSKKDLIDFFTKEVGRIKV